MILPAAALLNLTPSSTGVPQFGGRTHHLAGNEDDDDRHQDFEDPEHGKELLDQRRAARDAKLLLGFYGLCPRAEEYYLQLKMGLDKARCDRTQ